MSQLNVIVSDEFKAALYEAKAELKRKGKTVTQGQIITRAFNYWFRTNKSLLQSIQLAKTNPEKIMVEGEINGKQLKVNFEGEGATEGLDLFIALIEGDKKWISSR